MTLGQEMCIEWLTSNHFLTFNVAVNNLKTSDLTGSLITVNVYRSLFDLVRTIDLNYAKIP